MSIFNLQITFWLNENGHKVLIAAGDTFRAGAVEQLRTHAHHLNALHPQVKINMQFKNFNFYLKRAFNYSSKAMEKIQLRLHNQQFNWLLNGNSTLFWLTRLAECKIMNL